jgi:hypothetical protein
MSYDNWLAKQAEQHCGGEGGASAQVEMIIERDDAEMGVTVEVEDGSVSCAWRTDDDSVPVELDLHEQAQAVERAEEMVRGQAEADAELAAECREDTGGNW